MKRYTFTSVALFALTVAPAILSTGIFVAGALFGAAPAQAADNPKAGAERVRRAQILQRKLQEEKAALEAQLDSVRTAAQAETVAAQRAKDSLGKVQRDLGRLRADLATRAAQKSELEAERAQLQRNLAEADQARTELKAALAEAIAKREASERQLYATREASERQLNDLRDASQRELNEQREASERQLNDALEATERELNATWEASVRKLNAAWEARERHLNAVLGQSQAALGRTESARSALERTLADRTQALLASDSNRQGLARTARELLVRYEAKTCAAGWLQREPLFGLRRVAIETDVDRYRDVIDGFMVIPELVPGR